MSKPSDWKPVFLAALRQVPVISYAAEAAGVSRVTAWRRRQDDMEFAEAWDDALEEGIDRAEREAFRRAVEGWDRRVWHQGTEVGTERVYSDQLLQLVLRGRRKSVYAERTEVTGANGGPVAHQIDETAKAARVAQLMALAEQRKLSEGEIEDLA